jgi:hypothetical protein
MITVTFNAPFKSGPFMLKRPLEEAIKEVIQHLVV